MVKHCYRATALLILLSSVLFLTGRTPARRRRPMRLPSWNEGAGEERRLSILCG